MANACSLDGDFVRARLAELGRSQRTFAAELGYELRTLQRWIAGGRIDTPDAERIAVALGRGMGAVCSRLPSSYAVSPLERIAPMLRRLERVDADFAGPFRILEAHWSAWASLLELHGQPLETYVARLPVRHDERHRFVPLWIRCLEPKAHLRFSAQVHPRVRYGFGTIAIAGRATRLEELAFTRALDGHVDGRGGFRVDVWAAAEMRELVIASASAFEVERLPGPALQEFDRARSELAGALCFRPSTMDLRIAGLPTWDDRMR